MVDKPDIYASDRSGKANFDALRADSYDRTSIGNRAISRMPGLDFVPMLVFASTSDPTDEQKLALNYYELEKFPNYGDEKRFPSNVKARELAKQNILLHQDGKPTVKDGRIIAVNLPDRGENAQLRAWLVFPHAFKASKHALAEMHREAFRLTLKKEGFELTETGVKEIPAGLTPAEQLKLDCLTVKILKQQQKEHGQLDPLEQKALEDAARNLIQALASDDPKEFVKKFKNACALFKDPEDFKKFLIGVTELLYDNKLGKPLIDSFERLLTTKYVAALEGELHKDPAKLKEWLQKNSPDDLKNFPKNESPEALLAWLRSLHTRAFGQMWRETMAEIPDPQQRGAFCDFANIVLRMKDRFGAQAGLREALDNVAIRPDGNKNQPPDVDKTVAAIDQAGNDPAGKASKAAQPGEFIPQPIVLPEDADPNKDKDKWPWYSYLLGIPLAYMLVRQVPYVRYPFRQLELVVREGIRRYRDSRPGGSDTRPGDTEKLRDDKMFQEDTKRGYRDSVVFRAINGLDLVGDAKGSGDRLSLALTDFAIAKTLDPRLLDERLKISVRFGEAGEPTNGFEKGRLNVTTSGDKTTVELVFPPDASRTEIAADCYLLLYEIERNGKAPDKAFGKSLSVPEQKAVRGEAQVILFTTDMRRTGAPGGDVAATVGDRVPIPTGAEIPVIKVSREGVSIEETKIASKDLLTDLSREYEKAIKEMERKGEGDSERCKEARKMKAEIDGALADMNSKDTAVQERGSTRAQAVIEKHLPKPGSPAHALMLKDLKDARTRGGGADATRSRAVVVTMLFRAFVH